jgi:hypothetical protein
MTMNTTKLSALAAAVAAAWAAGAQAAAPAVSENFYVSGASAARAVTPAIAASACVAGTIVRYEYATTPGDYNLTICTLRTNAQDHEIPVELQGDTVAIYGRAGGGSLFGLKPILVPQPIRFLDPSTCATADTVDATIQQCTGLLGTDYASGTTPDAGLTDEDPQFLGNVAAEVDSSQPDPLTVAERNVLNGVTASGFTSVGTYDINWVIQSGVDFPLTNISRQAWRGVMAGTYTSVGDVMRAMGQVPSAAQRAAGLKVCLRTNTSGTQSGHVNAALGSNYCGSPGPLPALNETSDDGVLAGRPANYDVVLNSSSSTLESCLAGVVADRARSIGINSMENAGNNSNGFDAFINEMSLDGVAPTLQNAAQGIYDLYNESTMQWNTTFINGPTIAGRSTAAQRAAFIDMYSTKVKDPTAIANSGLNGIMATPFAATPDLVWNAAHPVAWTSKFTGFGGSNCNQSLIVFPDVATE